MGKTRHIVLYRWGKRHILWINRAKKLVFVEGSRSPIFTSESNRGAESTVLSEARNRKEAIMFRVTLIVLATLTLQSTLTIADTLAPKRSTDTKLWCEVTVTDNGSTTVHSGWLEHLDVTTVTIAVPEPAERGVPVLGEIPYIAHLFKNTGELPKSVKVIELARVGNIKLTKRPNRLAEAALPTPVVVSVDEEKSASELSDPAATIENVEPARLFPLAAIPQPSPPELSRAPLGSLVHPSFDVGSRPIANPYFTETQAAPIAQATFSEFREDSRAESADVNPWAVPSPINVPSPPSPPVAAGSPSADLLTQELMTLAAENGRLRGREEMRERIVALTLETTRIQARLLVTQVQLDTLQTTLRLNAAVAALVAEKEPQQLAEVLKLLQQSIEDQAAKMTN